MVVRQNTEQPILRTDLKLTATSNSSVAYVEVSFDNSWLYQVSYIYKLDLFLQCWFDSFNSLGFGTRFCLFEDNLYVLS